MEAFGRHKKYVAQQPTMWNKSIWLLGVVKVFYYFQAVRKLLLGCCRSFLLSRKAAVVPSSALGEVKIVKRTAKVIYVALECRWIIKSAMRVFRNPAAGNGSSNSCFNATAIAVGIVAAVLFFFENVLEQRRCCNRRYEIPSCVFLRKSNRNVAYV